MVNRDALLNEIRMAMVRFSHGEPPNTRIVEAMTAVALQIDGTWQRQDMIDLIGAMLYTTEQADARV